MTEILNYSPTLLESEEAIGAIGEDRIALFDSNMMNVMMGAARAAELEPGDSLTVAVVSNPNDENAGSGPNGFLVIGGMRDGLVSEGSWSIIDADVLGHAAASAMATVCAHWSKALYEQGIRMWDAYTLTVDIAGLKHYVEQGMSGPDAIQKATISEPVWYSQLLERDLEGYGALFLSSGIGQMFLQHVYEDLNALLYSGLDDSDHVVAKRDGVAYFWGSTIYDSAEMAARVVKGSLSTGFFEVTVDFSDLLNRPKVRAYHAPMTVEPNETGLRTVVSVEQVEFDSQTLEYLVRMAEQWKSSQVSEGHSIAAGYVMKACLGLPMDEHDTDAVRTVRTQLSTVRSDARGASDGWYLGDSYAETSMYEFSEQADELMRVYRDVMGG